jgi:esterase/lipase superfamily enzyme
MLGMSGTYVMDRRMDGYWDEDYYFHQPTRFLPDLDGEPLRQLRDAFFVLGIGQNYENHAYTDAVAAVLEQKRIPHRVERWGSASGHDWPTWRTMLPLFLNRLTR